MKIKTILNRLLLRYGCSTPSPSESFIQCRINIRLFIVLHYQGLQHFLHCLIFIRSVSICGKCVPNHCKVIQLKPILADQFLTSTIFLNIWIYDKISLLRTIGLYDDTWKVSMGCHFQLLILSCLTIIIEIFESFLKRVSNLWKGWDFFVFSCLFLLLSSERINHCWMLLAVSKKISG